MILPAGEFWSGSPAAPRAAARGPWSDEAPPRRPQWEIVYGALSLLIAALPGSGAVDLALSPNGIGEQRLRGVLSGLDRVERVEPLAHPDGAADLRLRLYVTGSPSELLAPVSALLHEHEVSVRELALGSATLEDVFLHLTGRELR